MNWTGVLTSGISLLASFIVGLLAWGLRAELQTLRTELNVVRMEVRASIAEASNTFFQRVNGNYVKRDTCQVSCGSVMSRLDGLESRMLER